MGRVELYREERSEGTEYTVEWRPNREEKGMGATRQCMLLTEKEFIDLVNAGLKFVGKDLKVA